MALLVTASTATSGHAAGLQIASSLNDVLNNIRNWITGILAAVAIAFLTWGGLKYLISAGDPGEVEKAKSALKNAAYGFALAALAPLIVAVLQSIIG